MDLCFKIDLAQFVEIYVFAVSFKICFPTQPYVLLTKFLLCVNVY